MSLDNARSLLKKALSHLAELEYVLEGLERNEIVKSVYVAAPLAAELQTPGLAEDTEELS